jgi:membrane protein YqaA with SNARE-associated domain
MGEKTKKTNIFLLVFLIILVIITYFAWKYPNFGDRFSVANWFSSDSISSLSFWTVIGFVSIVCFLGALIPVPVPYTLALTVFAFEWYENIDSPWGMIFGMIIFATVANSIGDMLDYVIGQGTQYVLSKDNPDLQNRWAKIILKRPKAIPYIIALFGLTPLPDSMLLVPLGMIKYSVKKTMVWMLIGKFFMMLLSALAGIYGLQWVLTLMGANDGENGWITGVVLLFLVWIMIVLMVKFKPKESSENKLNIVENVDSTTEK